MAKPTGKTRLELKVKGPNGTMRGLGQKLTGHFGPGSVVVQGFSRGECRVVVKNADIEAVRSHLLQMGLSAR